MFLPRCINYSGVRQVDKCRIFFKLLFSRATFGSANQRRWQRMHSYYRLFKPTCHWSWGHGRIWHVYRCCHRFLSTIHNYQYSISYYPLDNQDEQDGYLPPCRLFLLSIRRIPLHSQSSWIQLLYYDEQLQVFFINWQLLHLHWPMCWVDFSTFFSR